VGATQILKFPECSSWSREVEHAAVVVDLVQTHPVEHRLAHLQRVALRLQQPEHLQQAELRAAEEVGVALQPAHWWAAKDQPLTTSVSR